MSNEEYNSIENGSYIIFNDNSSASDYFLKVNQEYYVFRENEGIPTIHNEVGEVLYIHRRYMTLFDMREID